MVGSQTALKAIWASLLKQPPGHRSHHQGRARNGAVGRVQVLRGSVEIIGSWTTKIARLPVPGSWHPLVYTKTAEFGF